MQPAEEPKSIRFDNIVASTHGLAETHGKKVILFVPAGEIDRIALKFSRPEHRPAVSLVIGSVLGLIGVVGLVEFCINLRAYRFELAMVAMGIIGGSIIFDALKVRYFLEVEGKSGPRRLVFSKPATKEGIDQFRSEAGALYKYHITDNSRAT